MATPEQTAKTAKIGMIGLAVMGENLAMNIERNGFLPDNEILVTADFRLLAHGSLNLKETSYRSILHSSLVTRHCPKGGGR